MATDIAPAADQAGAPGIGCPLWFLRRTASIASTADPEDVRRAWDGMKVVPRDGLDARNGEQVPDTCLGAALVAFHGHWPCRNEAYIMSWLVLAETPTLSRFERSRVWHDLATGRKLIPGFQPGRLIPFDAGDLRGLDVPNSVSGPSPAEVTGPETATFRAVLVGLASRARAGPWRSRGRWIRWMLSVFMSSRKDGEARASG